MLPSAPADATAPEVTPVFDPASNTISYIVRDPDSKSCAVIDAVMNFDYASGRTSFDGADAIISNIQARGLTLEWLIETHVHADHLSGAPYIQHALGGAIGIGARISEVQDVFGEVFNAGTKFERDGAQFDRLFEDAAAPM